MGVEVIFNKFAAIGAILEAASKQAETDIADAAVKHIQEHIIVNGQVETGDMLNSVVALDNTVTVGVDYAVYQNYGTRFLPPRPFFEPGLDDTTDDIDTALEKIVARMESL